MRRGANVGAKRPLRALVWGEKWAAIWSESGRSGTRSTPSGARQPFAFRSQQPVQRLTMPHHSYRLRRVGALRVQGRFASTRDAVRVGGTIYRYRTSCICTPSSIAKSTRPHTRRLGPCTQILTLNSLTRQTLGDHEYLLN